MQTLSPQFADKRSIYHLWPKNKKALVSGNPNNPLILPLTQIFFAIEYFQQCYVIRNKTFLGLTIKVRSVQGHFLRLSSKLMILLLMFSSCHLFLWLWKHGSYATQIITLFWTDAIFGTILQLIIFCFPKFVINDAGNKTRLGSTFLESSG